MIDTRTRAGIATVAAVLAAILAIRVFAQAPSAIGYDLYQQALVKERAQGDLDAAIALYGRIVKDFSTDRPLAARALLRMAECYDQQRSPEAGKLFEEIVAKYSDQRDVAAEASHHLKATPVPPTPATLKATPPGLVSATHELPVRLVDLTPGALSPDGRWIALQSNEGLVLQDVSKPPATRLISKDRVVACDNPVWSRDSRHLAFISCVGDQPELRVIDLAGGTSSVIVPHSTAGITPLDWSEDGQSVLVLFESRPTAGTNQIALVSVSSKEIQVIRSGPASEPWPVQGATRLSVDGRFVVYTPDNSEKGVRLIWTDSEKDERIPESRAGDRFAGLTPSGRGLLFVSQRYGTYDLMLLPFVDGHAAGLAVPVVIDIGPIIKTVGFTTQGALYYTMQAQSPEAVTDLYVASLDAKGDVVGTPQRFVRPGGGHITHPLWSSDGSELAYKVTAAGTGGVIYIQTLATGEERAIVPRTPLGEIGQFDWSRDGKFFAVSCRPGGVQEIVRVDTRTGDTLVIAGGSQQTAGVAAQPMRAGQGHFSQPRWLPDGKSILYVDNQAVMQVDANGGVPRTVLTAAVGLTSFALARDGLSIAYVDGQNGQSALMVASIQSGIPRQIGVSVAGGSARHTAWSLDSQFVYLADRVGDAIVPGTSLANFELLKIPARGGKAERAGLSADTIIQPSPSPDGRYLAFSVNTDVSPWVHVLENFLPAEQLRRR